MNCDALEHVKTALACKAQPSNEIDVRVCFVLEKSLFSPWDKTRQAMI